MFLCSCFFQGIPPKNPIRKRGNSTWSDAPIPDRDARMLIPSLETSLQKTPRHVPRKPRETNLPERSKKPSPKHNKQPRTR